MSSDDYNRGILGCPPQPGDLTNPDYTSGEYFRQNEIKKQEIRQVEQRISHVPSSTGEGFSSPSCGPTPISSVPVYSGGGRVTTPVSAATPRTSEQPKFSVILNAQGKPYPLNSDNDTRQDYQNTHATSLRDKTAIVLCLSLIFVLPLTVNLILNLSSRPQSGSNGYYRKAYQDTSTSLTQPYKAVKQPSPASNKKAKNKKIQKTSMHKGPNAITGAPCLFGAAHDENNALETRPKTAVCTLKRCVSSIAL